MTEVQAPNHINSIADRTTIFLAGTIDMGNSADWQDKFVKDNEDLDVVVYNPRRDDWDPSWKATVTSGPFRQQVQWELDHLESAHIIIFNFEPKSQSPITLAELGLHLGDQNRHLLVRCPEGFYRKGNVDIMCERFGIPVYEKLEELYPIVRYIVAKNQKNQYAEDKKRKTLTLADCIESSARRF